MAIYQFQNKYNKITYFDLNETEINIKEMCIGEQEREYNFMYSDISSYTVSLTSQGFYRMNFHSNNKKIKLMENGKSSFESFISIIADKATRLPLGTTCEFTKESEYNIRKIIHDNTPLRSPLDELDNMKDTITTKYNESTTDTMGMIYIIGPRKDWDTYTIKINDVPYITVYTSEQNQILEKNGIKIESKAEPHWIDNKTFAFKIPFDEWDIAYTYKYSYGPSGRNHMMTSTKKIHIIINKEHSIVKLKLKSGLFHTKLIEI